MAPSSDKAWRLEHPSRSRRFRAPGLSPQKARSWQRPAPNVGRRRRLGRSTQSIGPADPGYAGSDRAGVGPAMALPKPPSAIRSSLPSDCEGWLPRMRNRSAASPMIVRLVGYHTGAGQASTSLGGSVSSTAKTPFFDISTCGASERKQGEAVVCGIDELAWRDSGTIIIIWRDERWSMSCQTVRPRVRRHGCGCTRRSS